jgi:hypothetical protein
MTLRKENSSVETELITRFGGIDTSDFPDFYGYQKPLEMGLWVLWVAKEKLGIRRLSAKQIASIIRDVKEFSIEAKSITQSFNRSGEKIHTYKGDGEVYFEIMKPGKDSLIAQIKGGSIQVFCFEPDKRYTSKRVLSKNILDGLKGELRFVDPYCGQRALDVLSDVKNKPVMFLTRVENLRQGERNRFLREVQDFKRENHMIEFRTYPNTDIHDRYIVSSDSLVILGHSIKDLGAKESFAIILNRDTSRDVVEALLENFNRRWNQSRVL